MRVTVLASGSSANATLIQAGGSRLLVDAGLTPTGVEERMTRGLGEAVSVDGIVLTHAHRDHAGEAGTVARHFDCPVWMSEATSRRLVLPDVRRRVFGVNTPFDVGAIRVEPTPLPHDAPNVGLVLSHRSSRVGFVTDLGHVPNELAEHLQGCQLVLLESNHDPAMLAGGPYPEFLKKRVASRTGHLSNQQAADLLARLGRETREVVLMHLSLANNSPKLALGLARTALRGRRVRVRCAHQDEPLDLRVKRSPSIGAKVHESQLGLPF